MGHGQMLTDLNVVEIGGKNREGSYENRNTGKFNLGVGKKGSPEMINFSTLADLA